MKFLVTGVSGFIGRSVADKLAMQPNYDVSGTIRQEDKQVRKAVPLLAIGEISASTDWSIALQDVRVVIHLAARAHILSDSSYDPLAIFRRINVEGTLTLARQALAAGVKRFIFISSIGVNGSHTSGVPFDESSLPAPHADYAISKFEAEQGLREMAQGTAMELVIIRPPLVYAGHAPGNFQRLLKLIASGMPLPFAAVKNQRSMIALGNLVDFIALCVEHPAAANELFLVSDGLNVSTSEIIRNLAAGMDQKARLFRVPDALMRRGSSLLGKQALYNQLCGSLVIDSSKACDLLDWRPPVTPMQALYNAGREFKALH